MTNNRFMNYVIVSCERRRSPHVDCAVGETTLACGSLDVSLRETYELSFVPWVGLEPTLRERNSDLNAACLPISPPRRWLPYCHSPLVSINQVSISLNRSAGV